VALANKAFCFFTEAVNVLRFGALPRIVLIDIRLFMYLGNLTTTDLIDYFYDQISHILISGSGAAASS